MSDMLSNMADLPKQAESVCVCVCVCVRVSCTAQTEESSYTLHTGAR